MKNRVFTVLVTYNGLKWVEKCIVSLRSSHFPTDIIVVDNGSEDGTVEVIKRDFKEVSLIKTGMNLGFGKANNRGIKQALDAGADFVFLLNQDAWIEPDAIGSMVETFYENPHFGIVSPLHLNGKGDSLDRYFRNYLLASEVHDLADAFILQKNYPRKVIVTKYVNAAAWLVSKACLENTGGFDPIFFHYGEDENYAQRIAFKGFTMGIDMKARIYHDREERITRGGESLAFDKKKEWNLFLIRVCNPANKKFRHAWLKTCVKHFVLGCGKLISFKTTFAKDHFSFMSQAISSYGHIRTARKRAIKGAFIV